jgi:hypothetical protein
MEGSRPAMDKKKGDCIWSGQSFFMNKVDCHFSEIIHINRECELWQFVDFRFMGTPIVVVEPVVLQSFDFRDGSAILGFSIRYGKRRPSQTTLRGLSGSLVDSSLRLVWARTSSETWILNGVGLVMAPYCDSLDLQDSPDTHC